MLDEDPITQARKRIEQVFRADPALREVTAKSDLTVSTLTKSVAARPVAPTVEVTQGAFTMRPNGPNSRTVGFSQEYQVRVSSGAVSGLDAHNALKWYGYMALLREGDTLGLPFVGSWSVTQASDESPDEGDKFPETEAAFTVSVEMYWDRAKIGAKA
jgi:hypothetical protein